MYQLHKLPEGFIVTSDQEIISQEPNIDFSALKEEEKKTIGWFDVEMQESIYWKELEQRREVAKTFQGQVAGRHPDMFGHSEMLNMTRGFLEGFQKAQASDKVFTRDDMFKLLDLMKHIAKTSSNLAVMEVEGRQLIESLSKQSWNVELEMEWVTEGDEEHDEGGTLPESVISYQQPKFIGGKIKILKLL